MFQCFGEPLPARAARIPIQMMSGEIVGMLGKNLPRAMDSASANAARLSSASKDLLDRLFEGEFGHWWGFYRRRGEAEELRRSREDIYESIGASPAPSRQTPCPGYAAVWAKMILTMPIQLAACHSKSPRQLACR